MDDKKGTTEPSVGTLWEELNRVAVALNKYTQRLMYTVQTSPCPTPDQNTEVLEHFIDVVKAATVSIAAVCEEV